MYTSHDVFIPFYLFLRYSLLGLHFVLTFGFPPCDPLPPTPCGLPPRIAHPARVVFGPPPRPQPPHNRITSNDPATHRLRDCTNSLIRTRFFWIALVIRRMACFWTLSRFHRLHLVIIASISFSLPHEPLVYPTAIAIAALLPYSSTQQRDSVNGTASGWVTVSHWICD